MKTCEQFEINISELIDGECPPERIRQTVNHLAQCDACMAIYREMCYFQNRIDQTPLAANDAVAIDSEIEKNKTSTIRLRMIPRWVWPIAAILLVSISLSLTDNFPIRVLPGDQAAEDNLISVQLEQNKGQMTEDRFIELTLELLAADRKYQQSMAEILHRAWNTGTRSDESGDSPVIGAPYNRMSSRRLEGGNLSVTSPEPAS